MQRFWTIGLLAILGCTPGRESTSTPGTGGDSQYLYLWTGSVDSTQPDFLAVLDVRPDTGRYGALVGTVPVPGRINAPHHTEHELAPGGYLFANGFGTGKTFIFDAHANQAGAFYLWTDRVSAEAAHDEGWRQRIRATYGSEPRIRYFDTPLVVDNALGKLVE